jgi:hypothetical protein
VNITKPGVADYLKALVFGPSGQGKTTFLGSAMDDPRTRPMLLLDFEGGSHVLKGMPSEPDVVKVNSWKTYNEVYRYLSKDQHSYRSLGIDSVSETNIWALLRSIEDTDFKRADPDALTQQDYGKVLVQMRRMLRTFRDLPMHVIYTATADDDVEPRVGLMRKPAMSGKLKEEVPALMDVVTYLAIENYKDEQGEEHKRRILLLHDIPKYRIKVRTPWGAEVASTIEDPTITKLLDVTMPWTMSAPKPQVVSK